MDKGRKLRRYSRKDYTHLVDFPVEIVGRDGVVRRYSFEESVRLYQRRIASAGLRYDDGDVVQAEVRHCRQRIGQLRRSSFARYGWPGIQVVGAPQLSEDLAGEVAAFLRRGMDGLQVEPEGCQITFLDESDRRLIYYVRQTPLDAERTGEELTFLLYLYRFESVGDCATRDAFFEFLKVLQSAHCAAACVETMVGSHHTADCGLVLTTDGDLGERLRSPTALPAMPEPELVEDDGAPEDPLRRGMALLRRGERRAALQAFIQSYESNHYRRAAYVGAAVVADQLGARAEAETAALMGSRYFPGDAVLSYHLAVARLRGGELALAREAIVHVRELEGDSFPLRLLEALALLSDGDLGAARRALMSLGKPAAGDTDLARSARIVSAQLAARGILRVGGIATAILGLVLVPVAWPWSLLLTVAGLMLSSAAHAAWRRQFKRLLMAPGTSGLHLANPAALRSAAASPEPAQ